MGTDRAVTGKPALYREGMMGLFKRQKPIAEKNYATHQLIPHWGAKPKWSQFSRWQATRDGYKKSTWVYTCVKLRADNVSAIPWIVERKAGDDWECVPDHPLQRVIDNPCPEFDWSEIMRFASYGMDLSGDGWCSILTNNAGLPVEIWPIIPDRMEVHGGHDRLIAYYKYQYAGITKNIEPEKVLHLRHTAPGDLFYGLSPLEAAARAVDIDEEAEKWQKSSLQNMGAPPGVFSTEQQVSQMQYEQYTKWISENSGSKNARRPWVLGGGLKWHAMGQSALDLDYTNGRKMTREEICAAFAVPPPLVGIYDNATLANIETARQILWREGLIPTLNEIRGQLNRQLAKRYGNDIRIVYDLSNVEALAENYTEKVDNAGKLWRLGVPLDEINRRLELQLELEDVAGTDVGYLPSGLLPADFDVGEPSPGGDRAAADAFGSEGDDN